MLRVLFLSLLTCAAIPGCVAIPVPASNDFSDKHMSSLRPGVTTRDELQRMLGDPEAAIGEGRYLIYDRDWAAYGWLVIASLGSKHWFPETEKTYRIAVRLNADVVSEIQVARVDIGNKENWFNKETAPTGMRSNRRIEALIAPKVPANPFSIFRFGRDTMPPRYDRAAVSRDGSRLAARHGDVYASYLDVFDLKARTFLHRINLTKDGAPPSYTNLFEGSVPNGMAFLADNHTLLIVSQTLLWSLDTKEGRKPDKKKYLSESCSIFCPFSPIYGNLVADEKAMRFFAVAGGQIWRFTNDGNEQSGLKLKSKVEPRAIGLSPNGQILTFDEGDGEVTLVDTGTAKVRLFKETRTKVSAHSFAFHASGSGTRLIILRSSFAEIWQLTGRLGKRSKLERVLVLPKRPDQTLGYPGRMAVSPDGRFLVVGSDRTLTLWDISTGKEIWRYMGDKLGAVSQLAFLNQGCRFVSVAQKEITIWDTSDLVRSGICPPLP
jgi:outer membrane protein assembly factor BamB